MPSPAAVAIGLGPANPSMISIAKETLFFRRAGISPALRLLVPTFSLPIAPPWVTPLASSQSERSPTTRELHQGAKRGSAGSLIFVWHWSVLCSTRLTEIVQPVGVPVHLPTSEAADYCCTHHTGKRPPSHRDELDQRVKDYYDADHQTNRCKIGSSCWCHDTLLLFLDEVHESAASVLCFSPDHLWREISK